MQANKIDACYCRLSEEDMQAGESGSIQNQKRILQQYADEHHFFNTRFFVDDGVSGVSFEREGLQAMLREVEAGRVRTVIVKDLSRLGRNYIRVGELIEIVFPEHDVRFIAVSDNVDSAREDNDLTPLRNLFNEWYAKDTSKKIRTVKQAKAKCGERTNGEVPYGYLPDPADRNHLIPDPETAHIVQKIFAMYAQGTRMTEILNWLRESKVLTVGALRYQRTGQARYQKVAQAPYEWPARTVYDILARQEYMGHTVTNKTTKISYKSKKYRKNAEEQRYVFRDTHEPLVSQDAFEQVQKRLASRQRINKSEELDLFSGLLYCADCGFKMHISRRANGNHTYVCGGYRNSARNQSNCTSHNISQRILCDLVLTDLRSVIASAQTDEREFVRNAMENSAREAREASTKQCREFEKATARMNELDAIFRKLYEDNALGRLSDERFVLLTAGYDDERDTLKNRIAALQKELAAVEQQQINANRFLKIVRGCIAPSELTYEIAHEFIDRICIHALDKAAKTQRIEIYYSFIGAVADADTATGTDAQAAA